MADHLVRAGLPLEAGARAVDVLDGVHEEGRRVLEDQPLDPAVDLLPLPLVERRAALLQESVEGLVLVAGPFRRVAGTALEEGVVREVRVLPDVAPAGEDEPVELAGVR